MCMRTCFLTWLKFLWRTARNSSASSVMIFWWSPVEQRRNISVIRARFASAGATEGQTDEQELNWTHPRPCLHVAVTSVSM